MSKILDKAKNKARVLTTSQDKQPSNNYNFKVKRWGDKYYRKNKDLSRSTHLMAWGSQDGKFYAFPTLFPAVDRPSTRAEDWIEPENPLEYAREVGELYSFDTKDEAIRFAEGGYKNM